MPSDHEPERLNPYAAPQLDTRIPTPTELGPPSPQLQKLARGLSICQAAVILGLIVVACALMARLVIVITSQAPSKAIAVSALRNTLGQICAALSLVGAILCLSISRGSKALSLVQAAVMLGLLRWVVFASRYFGDIAYAKYYYGEFVVRVAADLCFLLFLCSICGSMSRFDLSRRTSRYIYLCFPLLTFYHVLMGPIPQEIDVRVNVPILSLLAARWLAYLGLCCLSVQFACLLGDIRRAVLSEDGAKLIAPQQIT